MLFRFALEDAMRWVLVKQDVSKLNVHISAWFMLMMLTEGDRKVSVHLTILHVWGRDEVYKVF